ncbi:hypothetical protein [Paenibacillus silvae]|nr:hypothetical protein [Paenibacillus silvae]
MLPGLIAQCFSVSGYIQPITVELDCLVRELTGLKVPITEYSCQNMWLKSWYSADLCDDHGSWVNVGGRDARCSCRVTGIVECCVLNVSLRYAVTADAVTFITASVRRPVNSRGMM